MDKFESKILYILLIGILLCSVQAVAAADISDADDVFDLSNDIETVEAESIDEVPATEEVIAADVNLSEDSSSEVLAASSSDDILSDEPDGTFTDLYNKISAATGDNPTIDLDRNYVFTASSDRDNTDIHQDNGAYHIILNKNLVINGNGHTIDGNNIAALFRVFRANSLTLNDLNIVNCVAQPPNNYGAVINAQNIDNFRLTINNCNFTDNSAGTGGNSRGGVIYSSGNRRTTTTIIIKDSSFKDNEASSGSAIYQVYGSLDISNTEILENTARSNSLNIAQLDPEPGYPVTVFHGWIGNFTGNDNLINGIYANEVTTSFTEVTYLGGDGETTTSTVPATSNREAGITINLIILDERNNVVRNISTTTNSTGGYKITAAEAHLDAGRFTAYAVHYGDEYYTYVQSSRMDYFNSNMHNTNITNQSVEGYAGDKVNVTFDVHTTIGNYRVQNGTVVFTIGDKKYNVTVRNGQAKVEIEIPDESGEFNVTYDGTGTGYYWNSTGTLKITVIPKEDTAVTVSPQNISVGDDETIAFTVSEGVTGTTVSVVVKDSEGNVVYENTALDIADGNFVVSDLAAGTYNVTVSYAGDSTHNPSEASETFTVSKLASEVNITTWDIDVGKNEQLNYKVTSGATGTLNITITSDVLDEPIKYIDQDVSITGNIVEGLAAGTYTVKVEYSGDDKYNASEATKTFTVSKIATSINNVSVSGKVDEELTLTFTVTAADGSVVDGGLVEFVLNGEHVGLSVNQGKADMTLNFSKAYDEKDILVTYEGNDKYLSCEGHLNVSISKLTVEITVDTVIGVNGEVKQVIINVVDENGNNVTGGTVVYTIDYSTRKLNAGEGAEVIDGQATTDVTLEGAPGTYEATVTYSGSDRYEEATGKGEAEILKLNTTTSGEDVSGNVGDKVDITADILDQNGEKVQNGTATLTVDGKEYTAEVKDGKAVFEGVELTKNTTASIEYAGNDWYNSSETTIDITVKDNSTEPEEESDEESQGDSTDDSEEEPNEDPQEDSKKESSTAPQVAKAVAAKDLATGNPIAMLLLVLMALVSTISIRRQK